MKRNQLSASIQVAVEIYRLWRDGIDPTKTILENRLPEVDVDRALDAGLDLQAFTSFWSTDRRDFVYTNACKWGVFVEGIDAVLEEESADSPNNN